MQLMDENADSEAGSQATSFGRSELEIVLEAWDTATAKLQHTHEILREEVRRLTDELEIKNLELARKNRLADLGQMASHVAHEVRNGLAPVKLYMGLLARRIPHEHEDYEIMEKTKRGISLLETTVTDLLHFAADRDPVRTPFDPQLLFTEIVEMLAPQLQAQHIQVQIADERTSALNADREMLRRALLNLVINAVDAMPSGGQLWLCSERTANGFEISVEDSGLGIPADTLRRVFEPFFTTKSHGTGLGLAIVYRIAELHGGEVIASNIPSRGARFTLYLPDVD